MKKLLFALFVLISSSMVYANDSAYNTNGNTLFPYANTSIAIEKEVLTIRLTDGYLIYYDVDYTFNNLSDKEQTILMGFEADPPYPEPVELSNNGHPDMHDFTVEMNGKRVQYKSCIAPSIDKTNTLQPLDVNKWKVYEGDYIVPKTNAEYDGENGQNFVFVYYFNATFKPGINRIHHTYNYESGRGVSEDYYTSYKLTPANRWAGGKIHDFTLRITAPNAIKHFVLTTDAAKQKPKIISGVAKFRQGSEMVTETDGEQPYMENYMEISMRNATLEWHLTDYTPTRQELSINSGDMLSHFYSVAEAEQLCKHPTYYFDAGSRFAFYNENITPFDKRLLRNLPYAKRGYVFKDKTLQRHFNNLWWYIPDPTYNPKQSDFSITEWEQIMENK